MPLNFVRNLLFPRTATWQRYQQTKSLLVAILVAVIFAGLITVGMILINSKN